MIWDFSTFLGNEATLRTSRIRQPGFLSKGRRLSGGNQTRITIGHGKSTANNEQLKA